MFTFAFIILIISAAIFLGFGVMIVFHLRRFGFMGDATKAMALVFFIVSFVIVGAAAYHVFTTDWNDTLIDLPFGDSNQEEAKPSSVPLRSNQ